MFKEGQKEMDNIDTGEDNLVFTTSFSAS